MEMFGGFLASNRSRETVSILRRSYCSPRSRALSLILAWYIGAVALSAAALAVSRWIFVAIGIYGLILNIAAFSIRCPRCGKRIFVRTARQHTSPFQIYTWPPLECDQCGADLRRCRRAS